MKTLCLFCMAVAASFSFTACTAVVGDPDPDVSTTTTEHSAVYPSAGATTTRTTRSW